MTMTIRPASTIVLIGLSETNTIGYYARMMASESVLRRRDRLSDHTRTRSHQSCEAMWRGAMGIYRVFAGSDGESHIEELRLEDHPELGALTN